MPDYSQYQAPGVYVEDLSLDLITPLNLGLPASTLTIVGVASGYQSATESIPLFSATFSVLLNPNVIQDISLVVKTQFGVLLEVGTDYVLALDTAGTHTTLQRVPAGGAVEGGSVLVSYHYTSDDYYAPHLFSNYSDVSSFYGPAFTNDNTKPPVDSQLTLAAKVAFENGSNQILALAVKHGTIWRDDFVTAYKQLETDHRVSVLVSILPDSEVGSAVGLTNVLTDLRLHCDAAAANGYGRLVLTGAASFDETATAFETVAQAINNKRVVLLYPTKFTLFNPDLNQGQSIDVGGQYAAAACGARLVFNEVQRSLTRQPVNSFTGISPRIAQKMTKSFKDNLSSNGVCVIETDRTGRLVVRHGVTTAPASLTTREISLVRIADTLFTNVQYGMEVAGLIGQSITPDLIIAVKGALQSILEAQVAAKVIVSYVAPLVRQQALPNGDPSVIDCQFAYKAAVPLNYITVRFSLNLSTGDVSTSATPTPTS